MLKYVTVTKRTRDTKSSDRKMTESKREETKVAEPNEISAEKNYSESVSEDDDVEKGDDGDGIEKDSAVSPKFEYSMKKGDLFSCSADHSLAHCISADVRLGKGIATLFRNKFGGIDDLKKQGAKTGELAVLKRGPRYIYNLVTKDKYFQKPTYKTLESSLNAMKRHCHRNNVKRLAMPMIGCGLDGLEWKKVEQLIKEVFTDTDMAITVYRL